MSGPPASTSGRTPIEVAQACAAEAASLMRAGFGRTTVSATKGRGNVLTEVDLAVEAATMTRIGREFPEHVVLSEETAAATASDGWMWVIDPIDGTKNFSRGIPHFCFNIALCYANEPLVALTMNPITGETFTAVKGDGCRLNDEPVAVSAATTVHESVVAIDLGYDDTRAGFSLDLARFLWPGMQGLRVPGSAALEFAFVAAGRWDLYVHSDLQPWDVAAGLLLVREAGGIVTNRDGTPASIRSRATVAATPAVHADFLRLAGDRPWQP
jgi:fructose-1,6-bisphosphatase/inositol monophosphatase family enzyme